MFLATLIVGLLVAAMGCAPVVPTPTLIREPRVEPVLLTVGVRYPEGFQSRLYDKPKGELHVAPLAVGQASTKLLDEAFAALFERIVTLPPSAPGTPDLAAVIEPEIEGVGYDQPPPGIYTAPQAVSARITYRFTLYRPGGEQLASWSVSAEGAYKPPMKQSFEIHVSGLVVRAMELAMRDAAWKFMSGFRQVPDVRRWLEQAGVQ